jgi:hypothetical protein
MLCDFASKITVIVVALMAINKNAKNIVCNIPSLKPKKETGLPIIRLKPCWVNTKLNARLTKATAHTTPIMTNVFFNRINFFTYFFYRGKEWPVEYPKNVFMIRKVRPITSLFHARFCA